MDSVVCLARGDNKTSVLDKMCAHQRYHSTRMRRETTLAKFVENLAYAQVSNRLGGVTVATESRTFFMEGHRSFLRGNCPISRLGLYTVPA